MATIHATWKHVKKNTFYTTYSKTSRTFLTRDIHDIIDTALHRDFPNDWDMWRLVKLEYFA